jgi:hypothetical protein
MGSRSAATGRANCPRATLVLEGQLAHFQGGAAAAAVAHQLGRALIEKVCRWLVGARPEVTVPALLSGCFDGRRITFHELPIPIGIVRIRRRQLAHLRESVDLLRREIPANRTQILPQLCLIARPDQNG